MDVKLTIRFLAGRCLAFGHCARLLHIDVPCLLFPSAVLQLECEDGLPLFDRIFSRGIVGLHGIVDCVECGGGGEGFYMSVSNLILSCIDCTHHSSKTCCLPCSITVDCRYCVGLAKVRFPEEGVSMRDEERMQSRNKGKGLGMCVATV